MDTSNRLNLYSCHYDGKWILDDRLHLGQEDFGAYMQRICSDESTAQQCLAAAPADSATVEHISPLIPLWRWVHNIYLTSSSMIISNIGQISFWTDTDCSFIWPLNSDTEKDNKDIQQRSVIDFMGPKSVSLHRGVFTVTISDFSDLALSFYDCIAHVHIPSAMAITDEILPRIACPDIFASGSILWISSAVPIRNLALRHSVIDMVGIDPMVPSIWGLNLNDKPAWHNGHSCDGPSIAAKILRNPSTGLWSMNHSIAIGCADALEKFWSALILIVNSKKIALG
ncbi:MAG: hypothetical protein KatS3mg054_0019 [Chloroflexus sp.]|nr:MAG: hypothetical protein KatS3mg054_0019 [Chloroflexus sp.]